MNKKYFLYVTISGEKIDREVSVEEFCRAERTAGFFPKYCDQSEYSTTPATGGFSSPDSISGRIEYLE